MPSNYKAIKTIKRHGSRFTFGLARIELKLVRVLALYNLRFFLKKNNESDKLLNKYII